MPKSNALINEQSPIELCKTLTDSISINIQQKESRKMDRQTQTEVKNSLTLFCIQLTFRLSENKKNLQLRSTKVALLSSPTQTIESET